MVPNQENKCNFDALKRFNYTDLLCKHEKLVSFDQDRLGEVLADEDASSNEGVCLVENCVTILDVSRYCE